MGLSLFHPADNKLIRNWDQRVWLAVQRQPTPDPVRTLCNYVNRMLEEGRIKAAGVSIYLTQLLFTTVEEDLDWLRLFEASLVVGHNGLWDRLLRRVPYVDPAFPRKATRVRAYESNDGFYIERDCLSKHTTSLDVVFLKEPVGEFQLIRQYRGLIPDLALEHLLRIRMAVTKSMFLSNKDKRLYLLPYFIRRGA